VADPAQAWLLGLGLMTLVFLYFHHKTGDLRYSFMLALVWGKVLALILWALGLDKPLFTMYYYRDGYIIAKLTITANMLVLLTLLATNLTAYAWPQITRELTGARQRLPGLPERG